MHRGFTKLFNTIVTSTIWQEDDKTRIVWITMLAIADADGVVSASIPGLASVSNVALDACDKAIKNLLAPDEYSRTTDHEGRRIEAIDGGWRILNYQKYRRMLNEEERREYKARWIADNRRQKSTKVDSRRRKSTLSTQAEAEAEADKKKEGANGSRQQPVEDWLKELEADPTYKGIDVRREYGKMVNWCKIRKKQATKARFVNWLNRADQPVTLANVTTRNVYGKQRPPPINDKLTDEQLAAEREKVRELSAKLRDELKK